MNQMRAMIQTGMASAFIVAGIASAQETPGPIHIVVDLHCDPMGAPTIAGQELLFESLVDAVNDGLDEIDTFGGRVSFLSTGQFMEWVNARSEVGYPLIERLFESGGMIGTHMHDRWQIGTHNWVSMGSTSLADIELMWEQHIAQVNATITGALGVSGASAISAINTSLGTHTPSDDAIRLSLLESFGFTMHQQGPDEEFYAYFNHYPMTPYRPSGKGMLQHDPDGPVVLVPFGPVLGVKGIHFGIEQDMRLPAVKARFLLSVFNWLDDVHNAHDARVWVNGWGAHCHDLIPGTVTRDSWAPMFQWAHQHFVDKPVGGQIAAQFSSGPQARDAYVAWEAANPGAISFTYEHDTTVWQDYPYLIAAARYFDQAKLLTDLAPIGPVRMHRIRFGEPKDSREAFIVYTSSGVGQIRDLSSHLGTGSIATVDPQRGTWEEVATNAVPIPPAGTILVAPEDTVHITDFGDLDGDGQIGGGDLAQLLGSWAGSGPADLDGNGIIDGADLTILLGNWSS